MSSFCSGPARKDQSWGPLAGWLTQTGRTFSGLLPGLIRIWPSTARCFPSCSTSTRYWISALGTCSACSRSTRAAAFSPFQPGQGGVNVRTHGRLGADGSFHSRRIDPDEAVCRDGSEDHRPVHQGHPGLVEYGQTGGTDSRQDKGSPPSRGRGGRCDLKGSAFRGTLAAGKEHVQPGAAIRLNGRMPGKRFVRAAPAHAIGNPGRWQLDAQLPCGATAADPDQFDIPVPAPPGRPAAGHVPGTPAEPVSDGTRGPRPDRPIWPRRQARSHLPARLPVRARAGRRPRQSWITRRGRQLLSWCRLSRSHRGDAWRARSIAPRGAPGREPRNAGVSAAD